MQPTVRDWHESHSLEERLGPATVDGCVDWLSECLASYTAWHVGMTLAMAISAVARVLDGLQRRQHAEARTP